MNDKNVVYVGEGQRAGRRWLLWLGVGVFLVGVLLFWLLVARPDNNTRDTSQSEPTEQPETTELIVVGIANLTEGQIITEGLTVTVELSDISRVVRVEYYIDNVFMGVTYAAPFSFELDPSGLSAGEHILLAKAYDQDGNVTSSIPVTFVVEVPSVSQESSSKTASSAGSSSSSSGGTGGGGASAPDTSAPTTPSSLLLSAEDGYTTNLSWGASTDNVGVSGYRVFRDGVLLGTVLGASTTTYQDQTVVPGNTYDYNVRAVDAASNVSSASNEPSITLVPTSIWIAADSPQSFDSDPSPLELGVKFQPLVDGQITGVRFYKGPGNSGTHVGSLWTAGGSSLGSVTFTGETSTGWQEATFASPISVTADTTYVVSYSAPNGHISYTSNYFTTNGITSQYLMAENTADAGGNGVFAGSAGTFPSTTFNATNYWVDATFVPNPAAGGPTAKTLDTSVVYDDFPGSDNTGVPVGKRLPARDRDIIIYEDDAIMENIDITGEVTIRADDVTVRKSKINGIIYLDKDAVGAATWYVTVEDTEVDAGTQQRGGITLAQFTVTRSNIHGGQMNMLCSNDCDISDSWLHGQYLPVDQDWHLGGFLSNGGHDMVLTHNTISCDVPNNLVGGGCSGDLNLYGDFEPIVDVTIDGNLLTANIDAGYCATFGYNALKPFGPNAANITVINNVFQRGTNDQCAAFGPFTDYTISSSPPPGSTWTNNKWDDGTTLPPM